MMKANLRMDGWIQMNSQPFTLLLLGSVIMCVPLPCIHFLFPSLFLLLVSLVTCPSLLWLDKFPPSCPWWSFLPCPLGMQCFFHFTLMISLGLLFALVASMPVVFPAGCSVICFVICWPVGLDDDLPVGLELLHPYILVPIS